jgi:hypothetical protein
MIKLLSIYRFYRQSIIKFATDQFSNFHSIARKISNFPNLFESFLFKNIFVFLISGFAILIPNILKQKHHKIQKSSANIFHGFPCILLFVVVGNSADYAGNSFFNSSCFFSFESIFLMLIWEKFVEI